MTRRTWFRTITGAFATLATGLGLRKVEAKPRLQINPEWIDAEYRIHWICYEEWKDAYSCAYYDGQRWHFEDVKPEEET